MKSMFITGIDTDVGKTCVTAGFAVSLREMGIDVGIMKPFAAGIAQKSGFKSQDVEILAKAARVTDPEELLNPQFFPIPASPYTAWKNLKVKPNVNLVMESFRQLSKMHSMLLVEGIGGIMTPILEDYFVADLIRDMKLPAVVVTRTKIGSINHTVMTCKMCKKYKIPIKGIVINDFDDCGYDIKELGRDLKSLTGASMLGSIPLIENMSDVSLYRTFKKNIDFKLLVGS